MYDSYSLHFQIINTYSFEIKAQKWDIYKLMPLRFQSFYEVFGLR